MLKYSFLRNDHSVQKMSWFFSDMVWVFILNILHDVYICRDICRSSCVCLSSVLENSVSLLKFCANLKSMWYYQMLRLFSFYFTFVDNF